MQPATEKAKTGVSPTDNRTARNLLSWLVVATLILIVANDVGLHISGVEIVTFVIGLVFSIVAHEIGHLLAALIVGFKLLAVGIWPLELRRRPQGWKLTRWNLGNFVGGFVAAYPVRTDNLVKRFMFLTAAGPGASLFVGITAALIAAPLADSWAAAQLNQIAVWSFCLGLIALVPRSGRHAASDGKRTSMLRKGGKEADRFAAVMVLFSGSMGGLRPRDWDPDLLRRASEPLDDSSDARSAQTLRYNWLHDTGQLEEARNVLDWLLSHAVTKDIETIWRMEIVWFQARHSGNLSGARQTFGRQGDPGKNPSVRCAYFKANAALRLLEGNWNEAEIASLEGLRCCEKVVDSGIAAAIRDEIEGVLAEARSAKMEESQPSG